MTFIVVFIIMIIISFLVLAATIKIQNTTFVLRPTLFSSLSIHIRFGYDAFSQIFLGRIRTHVHNGSLYICTQYDANDVTSPVRNLFRRSRLDIRIIFYFVKQYTRGVVKLFPLQRAKSLWGSALVHVSHHE